jgi:hypothetical protein
MPKKENYMSEEVNKTEGKTLPGVEQQDLSNALEELVRRVISGMPAASERQSSGLTKDEEELMRDINERLTGKEPISVAFPECSDVMLSLINPSKPDIDPKTGKDEITDFFNDYFMFCDHTVITNDAALDGVLDPKLLDCTGKWFQGVEPSNCGDIIVNEIGGTTSFPPRFPPFWCLPPSCVKLAGNRHLYPVFTNSPFPNSRIRRLFTADVMWLFWFDRMGIFKILGAILDDFAIKGKIPFSNGSVNASGPIKDDILAIVLEAMVRKTETGASSTVRRRNISYRRSIGWILEEGRKLELDTVVNTAFSKLFHELIQKTLVFYKDKTLATAIQGITAPNAKTSVATLTAIKDTIDLLKRAFEQFDYGRNYSNTLSGIVWAVAALGLIRDLRTTLGIPPEYNTPDKYIPAAYDILVMGSSGRSSESNRYDVHRDLAENARAILLDLEVINHQDASIGGELELWLSIIEGSIEGYRTAYRSLTGIDLGSPGMPNIEQQV